MSDKSNVFDGSTVHPMEPPRRRVDLSLSIHDPRAQDLLLEYARRLASSDPEFSRDLHNEIWAARLVDHPGMAGSATSVVESKPKIFDRELSIRLIAQAREDDERMLGGTWSTVGSGSILEIESSMLHSDGANIGVAEDLRASDASGISRTRNNLRDMADQLEAACGQSSSTPSIAMPYLRRIPSDMEILAAVYELIHGKG